LLFGETRFHGPVKKEKRTTLRLHVGVSRPNRMFGFTPRGGLPPGANNGLISGLNLFKSRLRPAVAGVQIRVAAFGQQPAGPFDHPVVESGAMPSILKGSAALFKLFSRGFHWLGDCQRRVRPPPARSATPKTAMRVFLTSALFFQPNIRCRLIAGFCP
jgi:hypothetical protein